MQIPASPNETNTTDVLHDLPRQKARNLAPNSKLMRQHVPLVAPEHPYTSSKNLEIQWDHSHKRCHVGLIARRSAKPEKSGCLSRSHVPTRVAYVSGSFLCITMISSCVAHPLATRVVLSAMSTTDLPAEEIWLSTAVARTSTCHWVSGFSSTRWWTTHAPAKRQKLLLMSSDVTGWRHHSKSIAMQAPPH